MHRLLFLGLVVVLLLPACSHPQPAPPPPPNYAALNAQVVQPPDGVTVSVIGSVKNPGTYSLKKGATVWEAVDAAGGPNPWAYARTTVVTRKTANKPKVFGVDYWEREKIAPAPLVSDGDVIYVDERVP